MPIYTQTQYKCKYQADLAANHQKFAGKQLTFNYLYYMDKKISLDLANQNYYLQVSSSAHVPIFSSVFAIDFFLSLLKKQSNIEIYGYCFFPEQLHILVHSKVPPSQWLETCLVEYNQWHSAISDESGYLFDDQKGKQVLIQPKFLVKALHFIHNLPVTRRLCSSSEQFLYSSYHDYTGTQTTGVITSGILSTISHHSGQQSKRFEDYMATTQPPCVKANEGKQELVNHEFYFALADSSYITHSMSEYGQVYSEDIEKDYRFLWQECLSILSDITQLDQKTLLGVRRHHNLPEAHFLLAWLFVKVAKGPLYFAAKQLAKDQATVQLKINSLTLHHPKAYLRYIADFWQQSTTA